MKMNLGGAALAAALIVPALAFAQGPEPDPPDTAMMMPDVGPGGPGGDSHGGGMGMGMGRGMGMHRWGGHEMGLARLLDNPKLREQIGITADQAAKIRQETLDFQKTAIRAGADLQVKRLDLHSLLAAETPDRAAIDKSLRETNAAQFTLEKAAIDHRLAMRAMLTPEQRQKLQELRSEHHGADRGGQHGPMHRGGGMMHHPGAGSPPPPPPQQQ
jgi:periplasmic protein CpxP/Spy